MSFSLLTWVLIICLITLILALILASIRITRDQDKIAHLSKKLFDLQTLHQTEQTEIAALKEKLVGTSLLDALTGLPNRQVFEDRLAVCLMQSNRYKQICCVMFLDLDHFHVINEALSMEAGDDVLRQVATRLSNAVRQIDTVSRFGNNEFLFIFPQISKPETAGYIARRLLDEISQPFQVNGQEIYLTASIGITIFPADGNDTNTLIKNASIAMQSAKEHGRNIYQFYRPEVQAISHRDLILDAALRQDGIFQEFIIYYQPEIHIKTQRIVSLSALLCWQHPEFGLLSFNEFGHLAEASGRIQIIGDWLIRMICEQLLIWHEKNFFPETVTLPLSLKQLENQHFTHQLGTLLQECHLSPNVLTFLIIDTTFGIKLDRVEKILRMLEHLGVRKSIYGFGAGELSLQYLCRLSVDTFRIDAALVNDLLIHRESELIVQAIIALASSFNATIVAEGVETEAQKKFLMKMNCQIMQGPLFGKPQLAIHMPEISEKSIITMEK